MAEEMENLTLYVRGMNKSSDNENRVWDDTAIDEAYDNAMKIANEEVAKRIAMETNSNHTNSKSYSAKGKGKKKPKEEQPNPDNPIVWKEGMPCRAIYEEDGLEYEAFLIRIVGDGDCIVNFLGYDNNEKVPLSTLRRSLGDAARMRQIEDADLVAIEARGRGADDGFESHAGSESVDMYSDECSAQETTAHNDTEMPRNKKKKSSKKKSPVLESIYGGLPSLPMPSMNMFRNMEGLEMPLPPPPPMVSLSRRSDAEEQAISDMLLSWYMTGYYTGLYQGMKRQRQGRRYH